MEIKEVWKGDELPGGNNYMCEWCNNYSEDLIWISKLWMCIDCARDFWTMEGPDMGDQKLG